MSKFSIGTLTSAYQSCQDNPDCLCGANAPQQFYDCQQCLFTGLIKENVAMPDPRVGNQVLLSGASAYPLRLAWVSIRVLTADAGFAAACLNYASAVVSPNFTALALPPDWDGPFGQGLTPATTAITLIAALVVGGGAIAVVNSM